MNLIFIADLHLKPDSQSKNQIFFRLLASWQQRIAALYILGDFFDYWIGDDDDNPFIREIKQHLQQFTRHTPLYFKGGNHDFAVGKKFAQQTGIQLIKDLTTIRFGQHTMLLSHGDTFCTLDVSYQNMKRILQNPIIMFLLLKLPLKLRYKLKEILERKSANQTNLKPAHVYAVVNDSIAKLAQLATANVVIHGHTHHPGHYSITTANANIERYEIPDWEDHYPGGYIEVSKTAVTIVRPPHHE